MRQRRRPYREEDYVEDEDGIGENLAAVNSRLDDLTRQLERIAQAAPDRRPASEDLKADRVADALARLDRRLDQIVRADRPVAAPPVPPPARPAAAGATSWAEQISARQRALEGGAPAAAIPAAAPAPPAWTPPPADFTGLERQLEQINDQISSLQRPREDFETLRRELSDIRRTMTDALPRRALEALEGDVRALTERLDRNRQANSGTGGVDSAAIGALEHGLQEIRDALRGLAPAESLVGFEDAVRGLYDRVDQIAAAGPPQGGGQDPQALKQIEQAVTSLRGVVSRVASDDTVTQLAGEVRELATRFEHATTDSGSEALGRLEARIANLMERGRSVPPELEDAIRQLSDRLDRMQLSQGDQLALVALEDRIAKLSEKLDASDARLRQLDAIERGLADLLVHLEENRNARVAHAQAAPAAAPPAVATPPAVAPSAPAAVQPRSPLDLIQDAPPKPVAAAPAPIPAPPPAVAALPPPAPMHAPAAKVAPAKPMPPQQVDRRAINPDLPPHTPLEPGSGTPRVKPGSPAARIAASEAALGHARPAAAETGGKAAALAAARNAAKAAYLDAPVEVPQTLRRKSGGWLKWPGRKATAEAEQPLTIQPPVQPAQPIDQDYPPDTPARSGSRVLRFFKSLLIAASVAIIVVGAAQTAIELLWPEDQAASSPSSTPESIAPPARPARPMPTPESSLPPPAPPSDRGAALPTGPSFFDPSTTVTPRQPREDVTGSIGTPVAPPRPPAPVATPAPAPEPARESHSAPSAALLAAATGNNPAAEYELGIRYAEGRGLPPNLPEAVRWLERSANAGFAPAQFRLASLNEKGDGGLKKNLQAARRLYLAAANQGHAKSMHNLAVLHAEGVDGKPDYKVAAFWFRKAAGHGIVDSQYNLAILYARGIGVETNMAESYKWFALAAGNGDADAAKKRDEIGARLDPAALSAARLAAKSFVADREPDDAVNLKAPPGGWDRAPSVAAKPRKKPASPAP